VCAVEHFRGLLLATHIHIKIVRHSFQTWLCHSPVSSSQALPVNSNLLYQSYIFVRTPVSYLCMPAEVLHHEHAGAHWLLNSLAIESRITNCLSLRTLCIIQ
jgi:hypothetical protein